MSAATKLLDRGTHIDQFRAAMEQAGITPPDTIIDDGQLHRWGTNSKRYDDAGWYVLHGDGIPAGEFGDFRAGVSETFRADIGRELTAEERRTQRERIEAIRRQREAEDARRHAEGAKWAKQIWEAAASPAPPDHPYLARKKVNAHGLRIYRGELVIRDMKCDGALLVPLRDSGGEIRTIEFIGAGGEKRFLPGGRKSGTYYSIGQPNGTIIVVEGYATGASVHEATRHAVAVAIDAGNLSSVAEVMRRRYPDVRIIIAADNDESGTGQRAADEAAHAVGGLVAIPEEPGADWNDVHGGSGLRAVREGMEAAIEPTRRADGSLDGARVARPLAQTATALIEPTPWPMLDCAARYGILGEIVSLIEPQTEADPMAILLQAIVNFGATVGRGPHVRVEGDQHHAAAYAVVVGESSKARKGTSAGRVKEIFSRVKEWPGTVEGLSSGEGLKFHVRDAREEEQYDKKAKRTETVLVDPGVSDKRLLVVESEFAQALRQTARSGNTLSATVRAAWDTGDLRTLTKNDPIIATGAHISIVGHITIPELHAELTTTDTANGFANRFLFALVKRSKLLPFGGEPMAPDLLADLAARIDAAVEHARRLGAVGMTDAARKVWAGIYAELSQGRPGLLGSVTARSEAHALRLALIYALADGSPVIDRPHLLAALAIVEYAQASAAYIFGDSLGDPVADELLAAIRRSGDVGMTRTAIRDHFGRNQRAERLNAALDLLATRGLVQRTEVRTEGRPSELWRATTKTTDTTKGGAT